MNEILHFLIDLQFNNNREWFEENKPRYQQLHAEFLESVDRLIGLIRTFDSTIGQITAKECVYRIYRDVRFSKDKAPYKNHFSAYLTPTGRKAEDAGYYLHIEPTGGSFLGGVMLASGLHLPDSVRLQAVRQRICDQPDRFVSAIEQASDFKFDTDTELKRFPKGFPTDFQQANYLKYKDYLLNRDLEEEWICQPDWVERVAQSFASTSSFVGFLNEKYCCPVKTKWP